MLDGRFRIFYLENDNLKKLGWAIPFAFLVGLLKLTLSIFFINRGFDFTDEAFVLLFSKYPDQYLNSVQFIHYPLFKLLHLFKNDPVVFRWARIVLDGSLFLFLVRGLMNVKLATLSSKILIISFVFLSVTPGIFLKSLGYNEVSYYLVVMYVLLATQKINLVPPSKAVWLFLISKSILLAFLFYVKPTTCIAVVALDIGLLCVSGKRLAYLVGTMLLTTMAWLVITTLFYDSVFAFYNKWLSALPLVQAISLSPLFIIKNGHWGIDILMNFPYLLVVFATLGFLLYPRRNAYWVQKNLLNVFLSGFVLLILVSIVYTPGWLANWYYRLSIFLFYSYCFLVCSYFLLHRVGGESLRLILLLFAMPFVCALGTITPFTLSIYNYLSFWYVLLILIPDYDEINLVRVKRAIVTISAVSSIIIYCQFNVLNPQKNGTGLLACNTPISNNVRISLSENTAKYIEELKRKLENHGFKSGQGIIPLWDLSGDVYLIGGYSAVTPLYFDIFNVSHPEYTLNYNCMNISRYREKRLPYIFMLKNTVPTRQIDCLSTDALRFPESFQLVDSIYHPIKKDMLLIYKPIKQ